MKTSGLAIASLVCGIVGFVSGGVLGFVGLVLGIVALVSIGNSQGRLRGRGIAIGGLVTSAFSVVLGCAILTALLHPALAQARAAAISARDAAMAARDEACMGQHQTELAALVAQSNARVPSGAAWRDSVLANGGPELLRSLRADDPRPAFTLNAAVVGREWGSITDPARTVVIFECDPGAPAEGGRELLPVAPRHVRRGYLVGFADGSVRWIAPEEIEALDWDAVR